MPRYVTLAEFAAVLEVPTPSSLDDDATLALEAAEGLIDSWCQRRFDAAGTVASARTYTAPDSTVVIIDDATEVTAVATDADGDGAYETSWSSSDWRTWPVGAPNSGRPYTRLRVAPASSRRFPTHDRAVQVTAKWGWSSTPQPVRQAVVITAARLMKRSREAPFGVAPLVAFEGAGIQLRAAVDPDVQVLLAGYRRIDL